MPGAGCDELLLMCGALAMGRGDHAIVCKPTYQMYAVSSATAGARLEALPPREGLALDYEGLLERAPGARLVWICSPNNPTGEEVSREVLGELCASCPGLVVVDQAYLEFGGDDFSDLIARHENLIVCRTLSKGWALGVAAGRLRARLAGHRRRPRRAAAAGLDLAAVGDARPSSPSRTRTRCVPTPSRTWPSAGACAAGWRRSASRSWPRPACS